MTQHYWMMVYTWILMPLVWIVSKLYAFKDKKIKESIAGKKDWWQRMSQQMTKHDIHKPLIWFHVASAGEYMQAQPILERCLEKDFDCVVTFSSISGLRWLEKSRFASNRPPLIADYLPYDFPANVHRLLAILQPSAIVYAKFDLWPNLIWLAHQQKIPQFLVSATIQPKSKRVTSGLIRSFYGTVYACLDGIYAVTDNDAGRFRFTYPNHPNIQVFGDTRVDSVLDRKKQIPQPELPEYVKEKFVFIVGSSWPPDEQRIFPALKEALQTYDDFLLIIVPHEPNEDHLAHGETFFHEFKTERLTQLEKSPQTPPRVIMGDTVGVLSSLYYVGHLAYVGGAFTTGVHNVMEPSVMGVSVIFGPRYYYAPEAVNLKEQGFAFSINEASEFRSILFDLLKDRKKCAKLGKSAAETIKSQSGASEKCFQSILKKVQ